MELDKEDVVVNYTHTSDHIEVLCIYVRAWSPHLANDKDYVKQIQGRATKLVKELRN